MAKFTAIDVLNFQNEESAANIINTDFALLEVLLETMLSRDGLSPNTMLAQLDMNSNAIINLPNAVSAQSPVTLSQFEAGVATTGAAPSTVSYVTLASSTSLSAERVLTAGTGITLTDGGVNSTITTSDRK